MSSKYRGYRTMHLDSSFTSHQARVDGRYYERYNSQDMLCQFHRCLRKKAPSYLTCKFLTNSYLNYSTTRGANKIHLNNTNFYRSTFEYMGAQAHNSLPREIRDIISVHTFKCALNPPNVYELALYVITLFNISVPCFCLYSRTCMKTYIYCRYSISASNTAFLLQIKSYLSIQSSDWR